jgi:hypothetical protein
MTISGLAVRQSLLQERRCSALTKGGSSDWSTRCEMERQPRWRWLVGTIAAVRRLLSERLLHAQWGASDKQSISRCRRWEMYGSSVCSSMEHEFSWGSTSLLASVGRALSGFIFLRQGNYLVYIILMFYLYSYIFCVFSFRFASLRGYLVGLLRLHHWCFIRCSITGKLIFNFPSY